MVAVASVSASVQRKAPTNLNAVQGGEFEFEPNEPLRLMPGKEGQ
jgi:hypothetical protein